VHVELLLALREEQERLTQRWPRADGRRAGGPRSHFRGAGARAGGAVPAPVSLDAPSGDEHARLRQMVPDESADPTVALAHSFRERADLVSVLRHLAENERQVLRVASGHRRRAPDARGIGPSSVSRGERIRQIEGSGLRKLRALLRARGVDAATDRLSWQRHVKEVTREEGDA